MIELGENETILRGDDTLAKELGTEDPDEQLKQIRAYRFAAQNPPLTITLNLVPVREGEPPQITIVPSLDMSYEGLERVLTMGLAEVRRLERAAYAEQLRANGNGNGGQG